MPEIESDYKPILVIDGNTSISGELNISPNHSDELTLKVGWMRLDDLISLLARIQTAR